nr:putative rhamnogalacturonate lyase c [Quercus suber]
MFSILAPSSPFAPPSLLYLALTQPLKLLLQLLDLAFSLLRRLPPPDSNPIRIVCISDTHCLIPSEIPDGDLLIHAGDLTNAGTPTELQAQIDWLDSLPHEHKIAIAGNHDTFLDARSRQTLASADQHDTLDWKSVRYLQHASVALLFHSQARVLNVYGAPQIPACGGDEFAFQYQRGSDAWADTVPADTDVLVTHTPAKFHLDLPAALGCEHLLAEVWRVRPAVHVFGHVHAGKTDTFGRLRGGVEVVHWDAGQVCRERVLGRSDGLFVGLADPRNWIDLARICYHGMKAILWERVWGGVPDSRPTIMLNAALMYNDSGQLRHYPQVVDV